jgi:hypothetical protein
MIRRKFFRTLFGAAAAVVGAPLIPKVVPVAKALPARLFYATYIPLIKRVMPSLIASELISVQPMSAPSGEIFAMKLIDTNKKSQ